MNRFSSRIHQLERRYPRARECQHGFDIHDTRSGSLRNFAHGAPPPEDAPPVICGICGRSKTRITIRPWKPKPPGEE